MPFDTRPAPTFGYLVPEFPSQTHAFFWRELGAMRRAGATVKLYSTRRPPEGSCPHAFAEKAGAETRYLFPPRPLAALGRMLARPGGLMRALRYVASLSESSAAEKARIAAMIPVAAELCLQARADGVSHMHIHSCANAAHLGAMARLMGGPSFSLTLHGHLPVYGKDHARKFAHAAFVSTVTQPLRDDVLAIAPKAHVPVITMGVDTGRFCPPATGRPAPAPLHVVSVARLNVVKGHIYFLQAMRQLLDEGHALRYSIIGDGPYEPEIRAEIDRLSLGDHVTLHGALPETEVLARMQQAHALALTSFGHGEAAPVAVMEAMACGLPVICSIIGGTRDMIEDGHDGLLVPQQDVPAITEATRRLLTDPALRDTLGAAARDTACARFDENVQARRLLEEMQRAARMTRP